MDADTFVTIVMGVFPLGSALLMLWGWGAFDSVEVRRIREIPPPSKDQIMRADRRALKQAWDAEYHRLSVECGLEKWPKATVMPGTIITSGSGYRQAYGIRTKYLPQNDFADGFMEDIKRSTTWRAYAAAFEQEMEKIND